MVPTEWLFPSSHFPDRPLTRQAVERAFNHALEMAGLPRRGGLHALRHTFATRLLEGRVDLLTLQRLLGHSQFASTAGYQQLWIHGKRIVSGDSAATSTKSPIIKLFDDLKTDRASMR